MIELYHIFPVEIPLFIIKILGWVLLLFGWVGVSATLRGSRNQLEKENIFISIYQLSAIVATMGFMISGAILLSIIY